MLDIIRRRNGIAILLCLVLFACTRHPNSSPVLGDEVSLPDLPGSIVGLRLSGNSEAVVVLVSQSNHHRTSYLINLRNRQTNRIAEGDYLAQTVVTGKDQFLLS